MVAHFLTEIINRYFFFFLLQKTEKKVFKKSMKNCLEKTEEIF